MRSWWAGRRERVYATVAANPRESAWEISRRAGMLWWETERHLDTLAKDGRLAARWDSLIRWPATLLYEVAPVDTVP